MIYASWSFNVIYYLMRVTMSLHCVCLRTGSVATCEAGISVHTALLAGPGQPPQSSPVVVQQQERQEGTSLLSMS